MYLEIVLLGHLMSALVLSSSKAGILGGRPFYGLDSQHQGSDLPPSLPISAGSFLSLALDPAVHWHLSLAPVLYNSHWTWFSHY